MRHAVKLAGAPVWICIIICIFGNLAITCALYKAKVIKELIHYLKKGVCLLWI